MLNWIVWNRTDYLHKIDLALNNLERLICPKSQRTNQTNHRNKKITSLVLLFQVCDNLHRMLNEKKNWQTRVQSHTKDVKKWYSVPPCLTLSIIKYGSRIKWRNPGKGVVTAPTPHCSSYWKWSLWVTLD